MGVESTRAFMWFFMVCMVLLSWLALKVLLGTDDLDVVADELGVLLGPFGLLCL